MHAFKISHAAAIALVFRGDAFRSAMAFDFFFVASQMIPVIKECGCVRVPTHVQD